MTYRTPIVFAAIAALCVAAVASAEPTIEERSVTLRAQAAGDPQALYDTIRRVAQRECRSHAIVAYRHARHERRCREEFIAQAVRNFGRSDLTAVHEAERGAGAGARVASRS